MKLTKPKKTVTLDCDGIYLVFDLNAVAKISPAEDAQAKTVAPESGAAAESAATSEVESASSAADDNADSEAK